MATGAWVFKNFLMTVFYNWCFKFQAETVGHRVHEATAFKSEHCASYCQSWYANEERSACPEATDHPTNRRARNQSLFHPWLRNRRGRRLQGTGIRFKRWSMNRFNVSDSVSRLVVVSKGGVVIFVFLDKSSERIDPIRRLRLESTIRRRREESPRSHVPMGRCWGWKRRPLRLHQAPSHASHAHAGLAGSHSGASLRKLSIWSSCQGCSSKESPVSIVSD